MTTKPEVTLSAERYEELVEAEYILSVLRSYGVDNWEGWDAAMSEIHDICGDD